MIRNLREIILNRIAEIIKGNDYDEIYATGKRPALEELEVLNKLLQNISETDLVNISDEDIKEGDVYRVSDGNTYIKGCFETPEVPTPCSKCSNYLESLRTGKTLVCNCTLGLTSNKEIRDTVLAGLKKNKDKYGKKYCPCSLVREDDTVCMCKEFREMEEGICHCQLYIKTKD